MPSSATLIVASATAFTAIKLAGAAYLVYLGISTLARRGAVGPAVTDASPRPNRRIFADGIVLNILNPKTAVFFLAFVPQFVDVDAGHTTLQVIVLGATFVLLGIITGVTYLGLGLATALSGNPG